MNAIHALALCFVLEVSEDGRFGVIYVGGECAGEGAACADPGAGNCS